MRSQHMTQSITVKPVRNTKDFCCLFWAKITASFTKIFQCKKEKTSWFNLIKDCHNSSSILHWFFFSSFFFFLYLEQAHWNVVAENNRKVHVKKQIFFDLLFYLFHQIMLVSCTPKNNKPTMVSFKNGFYLFLLNNSFEFIFNFWVSLPSLTRSPFLSAVTFVAPVPNIAAHILESNCTRKIVGLIQVVNLGWSHWIRFDSGFHTIQYLLAHSSVAKCSLCSPACFTVAFQHFQAT